VIRGATRLLATAAVAFAAVFAAAGCGEEPRGGAASSGANGDVVGFVDVTAATGVRFRHENGATGKMYFPETNGSGCGLFDYDEDGDLDLYFVQGGALPGDPSPPAGTFTSRLYRNDGALRFTDVTDAAGCGATVYGTGVLCGDYDGDGWRDLFVYGLGKNQLFRNRGDGTFEETTAKAGVGDPRYAGAALFADFDRDGDLDLYVGNYVKWTIDLHRTCALPPAAQSYCHPDVFEPDAHLLYRNDGNGTFTDVTFRAGITRRDGKALGALASDVDDDGDLDLFVANDSTPNFLYRNDGAPGELRFTDISEASSVSYDRDGRTQGCMGCDFADVDGDLDGDLIVTNLAMESNALYLNDGTGRFDDQAALRGVSRSSIIDFGWGVRFFDFEDDGDQDLLTINGHLHAGVAQYDASQTYAQLAKLLLNDGKGRFAPAGPEAGPFLAQPIVGRGHAMGDLDGDGDLDFIVNANAHDALVVERRGATAGHALRLELRGRGKNRDAIGARVDVVAGGRMQRQELRGSASFASWQELTLHFGLGAATIADRVVVRWPDGTRESFGPLPADETHRLEAGKGQREP